MNFYSNLQQAVEEQYDCIKILKSDKRKSISLLRHKQSGRRYIFRQYEGGASVYQQLLYLTCPHLPQIMEVAEADGKAAVLEEYVQGDTLDFLLEGGTLSPKKAKEIMIQLCQALSVLHGFAAVHRDVKPENVILRGNQAVLIDFDASRIVKVENNSDTVVMGTIGFAAPEQYGLNQSDARSDIYSMGVLLNLMLTGKHPSRELAKGRMGLIVRRCTQLNPDRRYQNVQQLMNAL